MILLWRQEWASENEIFLTKKKMWKKKCSKNDQDFIIVEELGCYCNCMLEHAKNKAGNSIHNVPPYRIYFGRFVLFLEIKGFTQRMGSKIFLGSFWDTSAILAILCCHIVISPKLCQLEKKFAFFFLPILSSLCNFSTLWAKFMK